MIVSQPNTQYAPVVMSCSTPLPSARAIARPYRSADACPYGRPDPRPHAGPDGELGGMGGVL
jgi:hypothetical protein